MKEIASKKNFFDHIRGIMIFWDLQRSYANLLSWEIQFDINLLRSLMYNTIVVTLDCYNLVLQPQVLG